MAQVERLGNLGYLGLAGEVTKGTPVTPTAFVPLYKETLGTDLKLDENNPIVGTKFKPYNAFMGQREHIGTIEVLAEPNTAEYFFDMLLTAGAITGVGPYTHPFTLSPTTQPKSYTIEFLKGQVVHRFWGVEAEIIEPAWDKNIMKFNITLSALGSLSVREIASVNTTTITLKTDYDQTPNKGFVVGDIVRVMKSDGSTTLDTTIGTVNADGITLVLGASAASYAAGDFIFLRSLTPSLTTVTPFEWARTQFCFASTAATALTATQTNVEQGSKWKVEHTFENKAGAHRSGSYDPVSLPRLQGVATANIKKFFDYPDELNRFLKVGGYALVIRHYSETGYELRITLNNIIQKINKRPLETGKLIYQEIDYDAYYNVSDGQGFDVKVINNLAA